MADERNPLDAQVNEIQSAAERLVASLERANADVQSAREWAARPVNVPGYAGGRVGGVSEIDAETAAIQRRNAADAQSIALDEARVRLLQQQNELMLSGRPPMVLGQAAYRQGGAGAPAVAEWETQMAAARAQAASQARQASIMSGVRAPYAQRAAGDTAGQREINAENAALAAQNREVVALIQQYGELRGAARAAFEGTVQAADESVVATQREAAAMRSLREQYLAQAGSIAAPGVGREAANWAMSPAGYGGDPRRPGLGPMRVVQHEPGPSAATEFTAWADQLGSGRNIASASTQLQTLGEVQARASQEMRKHGAMTSEFLTALGRGEVTVQEFGYQVASTAGKFAGWTAAAGGVFVLIGAFRDLTQGARDAQSEAANLSRFIPGLNQNQAAEGMIQTSRDLNVSIKEVGDSQSQFAKIFHDQHDSLEAARVSLLATKLDNVSAADSYKYFTGIIQEWKLNANDLPGLFDQISAAQRRMGARVSEMLPALARSSSAVRATGGDLNQLIPLIATTITATGRTGPEVGTAFARGAANFYRNPKDVTIETGFGLDPNQGFTQFLRQAIQRSQTLDGQQRLELAKAIGGPLRGGTIFAPLLGQQNREQQAEYWTAPARAGGSAMEELGRKLGGVNEQVSMLTNGLQRIGAELGRSGGFMLFGAALEGLNLLLTGVQQLIRLFNDMPASIRPWISLLIEARALMLFTQGTRFGGAIASATRLDRIPGFGRSAENVARDEFVSGARQTQQLQANLFESTTGQAAQVAARRQAMLDIAASNRTAAASAGNEAERRTLLERANALEQEALVLQAEGDQLLEQAYVYEQREATTRQAINDVRRRNVTVAQAQADMAAAPVPPGRNAANTARAAEAAATESAVASEAVPAAAVAGTEGALAANLMPAAGGAAGAAARLESAASTGAGALRNAGGRIASAGASLGRWSFGLIEGFFNPFMLFMTGAIVLGGIISDRQKQIDAQQSRLNFAQGTPTSWQDFQNRRSAAASVAPPPPAMLHPASPGGGAWLDVARGSGLFQSATDWIPGDPFGTKQQEQSDAASKRYDQYQQQLAAYAARRRGGQPAYGDYMGNIQARWEADIKKYKGFSDLSHAFDERAQEAMHSVEASKGDPNVLAWIQQSRDQLAGRQPNDPADPFASFQGTDAKYVQADVARMADMAQAHQAAGVQTGDMLGRATRGYLYAAWQWGGSSVDKDAKAFLAAQQSYIAAIQKPIDAELQTQLALAHTPAQRQAAYQSAIQGYQRAIDTLRHTNASQGTGQRQAQAQLAHLRDEYAAVPADTNIRAMLHMGASSQDVRPFEVQNQMNDAQRASLRSQIHAQIDAVKHLSGQRGVTDAATRQGVEELRALQQAQVDAQFQARDQSRNVLLAYQQSTTEDKSQQIQDSIKMAGQAVQDALKTYGAHSDQYLQAVTAQNQAIQQQADYNRQTITSQGNLAASRIMTQGTAGDLARGRVALQTAQRMLAHDQQHHADKNTLIDDVTAVNNAQFQLEQLYTQQLQDQQAIWDAVFTARHVWDQGNPIQAARDTLQQDIHDMQYQSTPQQRAAQQAKIQQDRYNVSQQIINTDVQNAQFEYDMGRISDAQYIDKLRQILHMRHLSVQTRQQLLEQINQIEHTAGQNLELNVGQIKLPTLYDVRRAQAAAAASHGGSFGGPGLVVSHNAQMNFTINVAKAQDASTVFSAIEDATHTSFRGSLRAAGVI